MKAIVTADLHIRSDLPRCRIDENWEETQRLMVENLVNIANKYKVPLIIDGDLFDSGNLPARFIVMLIQEFSNINDKVYFLAGNHDLPYHSLENASNSSIGIFISMSKGHKKIKHGMGEFGKWHDFDSEITGTDTKILFTHQLVFKDTKSIPPNCKGKTALELLEEYPEYDWIFTGDNHKAFQFEKDGRHVVNPGCTIRQSANEKEYSPSVYLIDTNYKTILISLIDNAEMVDDSYIKKENDRDERIGAFIEGVKKSKTVSLSFVDNVEKGIEKNKKTLSVPIINMIHELMGEEK